MDNEGSVKTVAFEPWFVGLFVQGVVFLGFIPILIPLIVLELFGDPGTVGVVMSVLGFSALSSLMWGAVASRGPVGKVHLAGLLQPALGGFTLAIAGDQLVLWMLGTLFIGLGSAANLSMSFTLIGGAGLPPAEESSKIASLQMMLPMGQVVGLLMVALLLFLITDTDSLRVVSFSTMACFGIFGLLVVGLTNRIAIERLKKASNSLDREGGGESAESMGYRRMLFLAFMLAVFLAMMPISIFESQLPNLMLDVWEIEPDLTSLVLAIGVALTIFVYRAGGRLQARRGPLSVWWVCISSESGSTSHCSP